MLSSFFAVSALGLVACNFLSNDWKDHHPEAVSAYDTRQTAGASARALLSDAQFKGLTVEIQAVSGYEPSMDAVNSLKEFLVSHLNKRAIDLVEDDPIPSQLGASGAYGITDVRAIESRYRQQYPHDDRLTAYVLFLDGRSSDDQGGTKVLGQAHLNTSIVVFAKTLRDSATDALPRHLLEATVMRHEFGHLLGLVNLGTVDQAHHEDQRHHMHCSATSCLMYYAADTTDLLASLQGTEVPDLDAHCLQDLKTNEGR